jgi:hypothetical protein
MSGWQEGFAQQSRSTFAAEFADDVVLDATTLVAPIQGRELVATVMATASSIYETLDFTESAHAGSTSYLQWRATAFGGMEIRGITILDRDADGKVTRAAIHHRPLPMVLRFSAEMRKRLSGVAAAEHFIGQAP